MNDIEAKLRALEEESKVKKENFKLIKCDVCPNIVCRSNEEWKIHKRDLIHRQKMVLKAGAAYEPHHNTPFFCKACNVKLKDELDFRHHKKSESHKIKLEEDRERSYCKICKKQFNSAAQLLEHCKGKLHREMVSTKRETWKRSKNYRKRKRNLYV